MYDGSLNSQLLEMKILSSTKLRRINEKKIKETGYFQSRQVKTNISQTHNNSNLATGLDMV